MNKNILTRIFVYIFTTSIWLFFFLLSHNFFFFMFAFALTLSSPAHCTTHMRHVVFVLILTWFFLSLSCAKRNFMLSHTLLAGYFAWIFFLFQLGGRVWGVMETLHREWESSIERWERLIVNHKQINCNNSIYSLVSIISIIPLLTAHTDTQIKLVYCDAILNMKVEAKWWNPPQAEMNPFRPPPNSAPIIRVSNPSLWPTHTPLLSVVTNIRTQSKVETWILRESYPPLICVSSRSLTLPRSRHTGIGRRRRRRHHRRRSTPHHNPIAIKTKNRNFIIDFPLLHHHQLLLLFFFSVFVSKRALLLCRSLLTLEHTPAHNAGSAVCQLFEEKRGEPSSSSSLSLTSSTLSRPQEIFHFLLCGWDESGYFVGERRKTRKTMCIYKILGNISHASFCWCFDRKLVEWERKIDLLFLNHRWAHQDVTRSFYSPSISLSPSALHHI